MTRVSVQLSIIVPTYNERDNVVPVVEAIARALPGEAWEIIFVDDDSPDGTAARVRELAASDARVRCLQRIDRRGLASACIEGMLASAAPLLCVMDADLQHDETLLPRMLEQLRGGETELVVASRYLEGGSTGALAQGRVRLSRLANRIASLAYRAPLTDPMSGFFMLKRALMEETVRRLSGRGFKILLDLLLSARRPVRVVELPYHMRARQAGESKLDAPVAWDFMVLVAARLLGRLVPARFISFAAVGASGLLVHVLVLWILFRLLGSTFVPAQALATLVAMTGNFFLNNLFTWGDRRLRGAGLLRGLLTFYAACAFGALINVSLAARVFEWLPGQWLLAGLCGALSGAVWNFAITALITWRARPA
jgi:dolichol-phosphate mannosyltransferase